MLFSSIKDYYPFVLNVPFLYPLKILDGFLMLSGVIEREHWEKIG